MINQQHLQQHRRITHLRVYPRRHRTYLNTSYTRCYTTTVVPVAVQHWHCPDRQRQRRFWCSSLAQRKQHWLAPNIDPINDPFHILEQEHVLLVVDWRDVFYLWNKEPEQAPMRSVMKPTFLTFPNPWIRAAPGFDGNSRLLRSLLEQLMTSLTLYSTLDIETLKVMIHKWWVILDPHDSPDPPGWTPTTATWLPWVIKRNELIKVSIASRPWTTVSGRWSLSVPFDWLLPVCFALFCASRTVRRPQANGFKSMTTSINDDEPESDISGFGSLPVSLSSHFRSEKTKMSKLLTLYQTEAADPDV